MDTKTNNIYAFDFDGTLVRKTTYSEYQKYGKCVNPDINVLYDFLSFKPFIDPGVFGVPWFILTSRPLMDKRLIHFVIDRYNMKPMKVITQNSLDTLRSGDEEIEWKKDILGVLYTKESMKEHRNLIYVDNDLDRWKKPMQDIGIECINVIEFMQRVATPEIGFC